jgi:SAM-dependent methyltransferase
MGVWTDRVVPRLTDRALAAPPVAELRDVVCAGLHGRVLEVGFGSGRNLPHYPAEVVSVTAVDPSDVGWALSEVRRARSAVPVERGGLDGRSLAQASASYDCVLVTFTLCTVPDPAAALAEAMRALRPGGTLHFLEHGLSPDPGVAAWQHRLDPVQRRVFGGCHLTRDLPALIRAAGFEGGPVSADYLPGPALARPWGWTVVGTAVRPGGA